MCARYIVTQAGILLSYDCQGVWSGMYGTQSLLDFSTLAHPLPLYGILVIKTLTGGVELRWRTIFVWTCVSGLSLEFMEKEVSIRRPVMG